MTQSRLSIGVAAAVLATTLLLVGPAPAPAQDAGKGEFKNLTVLPTTISRKDLTKLMKEWNKALGVKCSACHKDIKKAELDDTDLKKATREMVKMQDQLNKILGTIKPEMKVGCFSCHHGKEKVPVTPPAEEAQSGEE